MAMETATDTEKGPAVVDGVQVILGSNPASNPALNPRPNPAAASAGARPAAAPPSSSVWTAPPRAARKPPPSASAPAKRRAVQAAGIVQATIGPAVTILAAVLLAFAADVTLLGNLKYSRDQEVKYADFRVALATATAPLGQVDGDGKILGLGTPVALLQIPQIGLSTIVSEGTTSGLLESGPGHRRDTPLPGQSGFSVIVGRAAAFGGPFQDIVRLNPGTVFTVTTGEGVSRYKVIDVRHAHDPYPPALAAGAGRLTLATADGPAYQPTGVVYLDADLVGPAMQTPKRTLTAAQLTLSEVPGSIETSGIVLLVIWAQLLVAGALALSWLRVRWGYWQAWTSGVPVLGTIVIALAEQLARLLPNVM